MSVTGIAFRLGFTSVTTRILWATVLTAKFPIRITVQFYKATSNGVVSDDDLEKIQRTIDGVYEHADAVGSLVLPEDDRRRPTAWQTVPNEWFPW